jgi:hypothetical protein
MDIRLLDNVTHTALTERMKTKVCSINDAVGNILRFNDKIFIVTCKHVADDFFKRDQGYIILRDNTRIYSNQLRYISSTKDFIDIALIEILNTENINDFFEGNDLLILDDFKSEFEKSLFFIFGFPAQLYFQKEEKEYIPWISYMTIKSNNIESNENFLYLDYDINSEKNIINEKELKTKLPKAPGLSGAFIFKINTFDKNEIWHPSFAKAVAIQSTWNGKNWIKSSNIKYLFQLLNSAT